MAITEINSKTKLCVICADLNENDSIIEMKFKKKVRGKEIIKKIKKGNICAFCYDTLIK